MLLKTILLNVAVSNEAWKFDAVFGKVNITQMMEIWILKDIFWVDVI